MTRRTFSLFDVTGGALWLGSLTLAGCLFGNIRWVKTNLSQIIWALMAAGRPGGRAAGLGVDHAPLHKLNAYSGLFRASGGFFAK